MSAILHRFAEPADEPALAGLAREAAAAGRAEPDPFALALAENRAGGRRVFGAFDGGRCRAAIHLLPSAVWIDAREARFAEVIGFRAAPDAGLAVFLATCRALAERLAQGGGELVLHGRPAARLLGLVDRRLGAEVVRTEALLEQELEPAPAVPLPAGVLPLERFDHQARWLWERCAGAFGASTIRDEAFLNARFVAGAAAGRYALFGARDRDGILRGFVALAPGDAAARAEPGCWTLVDWLVPPGEPEVGEALLAAARSHARAAAGGGAARLVASLPPWSPWFGAFQRAGFAVRPSPLLLAALSLDRRFDVFWLRDAWWTTLADTTR